MAKKKRFIPRPRHNPEVQARKIDQNRDLYLQIRKAVDAITVSHDNHISYLGNFARHDIKNSIQSMDSVLSTTTANEMTDEQSSRSVRVTVIFAVAGVACIIVCLVLAWKLTTKTGKKSL